jgi:hypothetical protein
MPRLQSQWIPYISIAILLFAPALVSAQSASPGAQNIDQGVSKLIVADDQFLASLGSFIIHLLGGTHLLGGIHFGAITPSSSAYSESFPLQTTLNGFSYYSTEVPFKDLAFQNTGWAATPVVFGGTCTPVAVDGDGYPTASLTGTGCEYSEWLMLHMPTPPPGTTIYPAGEYELTYEGTGTITVGWDASDQQNISPGLIEFDVSDPSSGILLDITSTDPSDYLRNIHVFLVTDASTYQTEPFQQAFLNELAPYQILRFMDWGNTYQVYETSPGYFTSGLSQPSSTTLILPNTASSTDNAYVGDVATVDIGGQFPRLLINSYNGSTRTLTFASAAPVGTPLSATIEYFPNETWASRASTSTQQQQTPSGVAYEYMIELANITNKDIWINIPTAADDDYVTQLATLLKDTLNPNLKIYVEYSNETWNFAYSGYNYSQAMSAAIGLPSTGGDAGDQWNPYRSLQIFHLFNQVFGEPDLRADQPSNDPLVEMLGGQTGSPSRYLDQLDWVNTGTSSPTYGFPAYDYADAMSATDYFGSTVTDPFDNQLLELKQTIDALTASTGSGNYDYQLAGIAQARGLKLIQYEGGAGDTVSNNNQTIINNITTLMNDPRMRDVEDESLRQWEQLSQEFPGTIGDWAQFSDVSSYNEYGFWGALESVFENLATTPRYEGILDYANNPLPAADTTPPSIPTGLTAIASSSPGEIDLSWNPSTDSDGIANYDIFRNGTSVGFTANATTTTYQDTGLVTDTPYTYYVEAVDNSENWSAPSASVTATTTGPDVTPPTVSITDPSTGSAVSGTSVTLTATASDPIAGIANVQFNVNGTNVGAPVSSSPYTITWDSTGTVSGTSTIYAIAEDNAGLYATSSISVIVDNTNTPSAGLVGYWPLNASTTNWTTDTTQDESGQGNTGTLIHLSTTTSPITGFTGVADGALNFSGSDQYVQLASTTATSLNTNFSISVWVYPSSSTPCCQGIISKGETYGSAAQFRLSLNYPGSSSDLTLSIGNGSTDVSGNSSHFSMPLNTWHHVVVTTDANNMYFYVDGVSVGTTSRASIGSTFTGDNSFYIGTEGPNQFYFYGGIDEVRMYNRVLTLPEVLQLYDQGL